MSRNNLSGSRTKALEIERFQGQNTASTFSEIDITESPKMLNLLPNTLGGLAKRPGSVPVSNALPNPIKVVANLRTNNINQIIVSSNRNVYKFNNGTFTQATMAALLDNTEFDCAQFKDEMGKETLIIADGGHLKEFDGTTVKVITGQANDASPLPPNDLTNINANHKAIGCLIHNTRVVLWDGSDTIWHSKIGYYDYYPNVDYQRFVRENDYVQNCVTYRGALIVFMRRHIGVLFGHDRENWRQDFLDTTDGCVAPKTVQSVTFPDGRQEIFYVSDNGVHSVYAIDTLSLDSSARYSTRSVTADKVNWSALGVTKEEWVNAVSFFYKGQYWLIYQKGSEKHGLVYDTITNHWYPINNIQANDFYADEDNLYFCGEDGYLKKLDPTSYRDWENVEKTTGKPIESYWYSKMMTPKLTGHNHFWDILMVEARQFPQKSSLDVEVNTYRNQFIQPSAIKTAVFIWGETEWGESQWANQNLTDLINNAKRLRTFVKGQYAQIKLSNDRDEPVEIYGIRYEVRTMDTYY